MIQKLALLALAGGLGTLARFGLVSVVPKTSGGVVPWGTIAVNLLGCLMFGVLTAAMARRGAISVDTRTIILVGFMGAFTTFSTFAHDTTKLLRDAEWLAAAGNMAVQNLVGIAAVFIGLAIGRQI